MKTLIGSLNVLAGNIFAYQLFVEKVRTWLLLKKGDEKSRKKNAVKARNWRDDQTAPLCEILVDSMNGFFHEMIHSADC